MVNSLPLVMVVDGDEIHREMLENMLEDDMLVISVGTAEECLSSLQYKKPDVMIVDPENEEIKGFELIADIRNSIEQQACSFIVLTNDNSFDARIQAYEAGANDFISKPFQPEELLAKVKLNLNSKSFYKKLKQDAQEAMKTALSAMKQSSDLGLVLRFMEDSIVTESHSALADVIVDYMGQFGVESSVLFIIDDDAQYYHCREESQEALLMAMCREKGRIVDVGLVTVINGKNASILVKEMPTDEARYGEIKDVLGIMINLADARAKSIATTNALKDEQNFGLQASVQRGIEKVNNMQSQLAKHTDELSSLMLSFRGRIRESLLAVGASEHQEQIFLEMVDDSMEQMESAFNGVIRLESEFKGLIKELTGMIQGK